MKQLIAGAWRCSLVLLIAGCVQMPTESYGIKDIRPQVTFRILDRSAAAFRVVVDGLDMGAVADFPEGVAALRLVPGSHTLQIMREGQAISQERFYAGDGVNRTIIVNGGN